jgi:hypothetical protein
MRTTKQSDLHHEIPSKDPPLDTQETRDFANPHSIPNLLRRHRKLENIPVPLNHQFRDIDLFEGIPDSVRCGEEVGAGGFAVYVAVERGREFVEEEKGGRDVP